MKGVAGEKGVILITLMWIMVMLSLVAWGLSRRTSIEVSLLETYRGKALAEAAARGGANQLMAWLSGFPAGKDSLYQAGIPTKTAFGQFLTLNHLPVGPHGYAVIARSTKRYSQLQETVYALENLSGRMNINMINENNVGMLSALLQIKGVLPAQADRIALNVVEFKGTGATAGELRGKSRLKPKAKAFEDVHELLDVNGVTLEIFDMIKDDITVYGPMEAGLSIDVNSASDALIGAIGQSLQRTANVNEDVFIRRSKQSRDGVDGKPFTPDDGQQDFLSDDGQDVLHTVSAGYYQARITGVDSDSRVEASFNAVFYRDSNNEVSLVSWQREP